MRTILISGLCLAAGMVSPVFAAKGKQMTCASLIPAGPKIRVLLEREANSAIVEAKGPYRVLRRDSGEQLSSGTTGKRFVMHALQDGLRWGEEYPDVYQIVLAPTSCETTFFVNGIQYKGAIAVYHTRENKIALVNELPIEEYIKATLSIKSNCPSSKEAMAALAITARTEAFLKAEQGKTSGRPWDVTAQEAKYYGYGVSYRPNRMEDAIDWTRFMVLEPKKASEKLQNLALDAEKAEDLADQGYDAKKILSASFPNAKLGVTINPDEIALR